MTKPIVAVTDSPFPSLDPVKAALAKLDADIRMSKSNSADDIIAVARDADAVIVCYAQITATIIGALTRCSVIGRTGLGVDNIDVPAAAARGIVVPPMCRTIACARCRTTPWRFARVARKILSNKLVQSGRWEMPAVRPAPPRRAGARPVGFGNIPRAVAPRRRPSASRSSPTIPSCRRTLWPGFGVEGVSFDELLARSDFISVHAPLMPATRGLINAAAFAKMKKGALIVNTARGPLIDEPALIAALDSGHLGGAALDVVTTEPLAKDSPLLGRDNVILTPHTAFYSIEALDELQTKCASDVARVLAGEKPVYPVKA